MSSKDQLARNTSPGYSLPDCSEAIPEEGRPFCTVNFGFIEELPGGSAACTPDRCGGCKPLLRP